MVLYVIHTFNMLSTAKVQTMAAYLHMEFMYNKICSDASKLYNHTNFNNHIVVYRTLTDGFLEETCSIKVY